MGDEGEYNGEWHSGSSRQQNNGENIITSYEQMEAEDSPEGDEEIDGTILDAARTPDRSSGGSRMVETSLPRFYKSPPSEDERDDSIEGDQLSVLSSSSHQASSGNVFSDDGAPDSLPSRNHSRNPSLQSNPIGLSPSSANYSNTPGTPDSTRSNSLLVHSLDKRFKTRLNEIVDSRSPTSTGSTRRFPYNSNNNNKTNPAQQLSAATIADLLSSHHSMNVEEDISSTPWEAIRWTKLRKLSNQLYSEDAIRKYGSPTVLFPSSTIALGTDKGVVLIFDYHQTLKSVLTLRGPKRKVSADSSFGDGLTTAPDPDNAHSLGSVTALAVSADQTYIGVGYSSGHIATWELAKPNSPNLHISPIESDFIGKPKNDGHLEGTPIIHLNFCGKRHSMVVSGDVKGMAFSHNAVRAMVIGRTVKTRRILGRYPQSSPGTAAPRKPTSILALAGQPLGTELRPSDEICLVAVMTPYTLALISTVPAPQTEFKIDNKELKETNLEMGMSACLAWFPALKQGTNKDDTNPKLAYCWSNVMNILEIGSSRHPVTDTVKIQPRYTKKFICDESIVAVQWASRQILILVTITQRLLVVNEETMTVNSTIDLLNKHVMHHDYFSNQLKNLTLKRPGHKDSYPVAIADAYFNCIRSFKGRIFLLGNYEFVVGSLSNWADRLLDVMETGDYVRAIRLATSYYLGNEDMVVIGLPSSDAERHKIVEQNIPDMITASLKYTFKQQQDSNNEDNNEFLEFLKELTDACILAIMAIDAKNTSALLSDMFEYYEVSSVYKSIFFDCIVPFIAEGDITGLPPNVFKQLVLTYAASPELSDKLEELICSLDTSTLDLDLTLSLCEQYKLRDCHIYIWNHALGDFSSPLFEMVESVKRIKDQDITLFEKENLTEHAEKAYPYISYVLTGRIYPTGLFMNDDESFRAKSELYHLLFSGDNYLETLKELIEYDSAAFFSALNEAFEDSFLNESESPSPAKAEQLDPLIRSGSTVNRQLIINILLDLFKTLEYPKVMRVFMNIFIARNYPKYSQFLILPGSVLSNVLDELCYYNEPVFAEERELAIQSLLSKYKPPDLERLISTLYEVHAYRVLQYIFRSERRYSKLLDVTLRLNYEEGGEQKQISNNSNNLINTLAEVLNNTSQESGKERVQIQKQISENFEIFVLADTTRAVELFSKYFPNLHDSILKLTDRPDIQYHYIRHLFTMSERGAQKIPDNRYRNLYISLLIRRLEFSQIHHLLTNVLTGKHDVELPTIVDDLIESRAIDILALLLERQGRISEAMIYIVNHLFYLDDIYSTVVKEIAETEHDLSKYVYVGMNLCQHAEERINDSDDSSSGEQLWARLIDSLVDIARATEEEEEKGEVPDNTNTSGVENNNRRKGDFRRRLLREVLSGLLESSGKGGSTQKNEMVLRIFKTILYPKSPKLRTVSTVRPILNDLFSAYRYQYTMLAVAKQLLDSNTYDDVLELLSLRLRGWKVSRTGECEGCGKKIIGVGIDAEWLYQQWEEWQKKNLADTKSAHKSLQRILYNTKEDEKSKSKGKQHISEEQIIFKKDAKNQRLGDEARDMLVIFKCGHSYHAGCLENLGTSLSDLFCIVCG